MKEPSDLALRIKYRIKNEFSLLWLSLQDVVQERTGQTASPGASASMVVAVTSGLGLAIVLLVLLEPTAARVSQDTLNIEHLQSDVVQ